MSVYEESGFRFDFTAATRSVIHDKADPHDGNTFWPGIDFRVFEENNHQVWVEVKSWSFKRILESSERKQAKKDYQSKLTGKAADEFRRDIVDKFLGTSCYLSWSGLGLPQTVSYAIFLEPPDRGTRALLGPFQDRLRDAFKNAQIRSWGSGISYAVVDISGFEGIFPAYSVTRAV